MKIIPLTIQESVARGGATHVIKILAADLTVAAAATAQVIVLATVGVGALVKVMGTYLPTPFQDASDAAFNDVAITIGDGGSAARYLTSQQTNLNGTEVLAKAGSGTEYAYLVADTVDLTVGSMTAKALLDIDVGELWVFLRVTDLALS